MYHKFTKINKQSETKYLGTSPRNFECRSDFKNWDPDRYNENIHVLRSNENRMSPHLNIITCIPGKKIGVSFNGTKRIGKVSQK